jgi:hypothetical protein
MTFRFKLEAVRVECFGEELFEWGKDEMRVFGIGVSRLGVPFTTGVKVLGSYGEGDDSTGPPLPLKLHETELEDNGLDVLFHVWLIEEDGAGVRSAENTIEAKFHEAFQHNVGVLNTIEFPRECIPFSAFDKSIPAVQLALESAATKGRNDRLLFPSPRLLRFNAGVVAPISKTLTLVTAAGHGAFYNVTNRHSYEKVQVSTPN